jgi:hypothetical protein
MTQVVECLLSKHEALNAIPVPLLTLAQKKHSEISQGCVFVCVWERKTDLLGEVYNTFMEKISTNLFHECEDEYYINLTLKFTKKCKRPNIVMRVQTRIKTNKSRLQSL